MAQMTDWPEGLKKTRPRRQVWEVLEEADMPLTAPQISRELEERGTPVWLSTIYRILDRFTEQDMADKTPMPDTGMALYEARRTGHRHYAVCVCCKRVIAMTTCPFGSFMPEMEEKNFHILGHRLQIFGYCGACVKSAGLSDNS